MSGTAPTGWRCRPPSRRRASRPPPAYTRLPCRPGWHRHSTLCRRRSPTASGTARPRRCRRRWQKSQRGRPLRSSRQGRWSRTLRWWAVRRCRAHADIGPSRTFRCRARSNVPLAQSRRNPLRPRRAHPDGTFSNPQLRSARLPVDFDENRITTATTLTSADHEAFRRDGVIRVRSSFLTDDAVAMRESVWRTLERRVSSVTTAGRVTSAPPTVSSTSRPPPAALSMRAGRRADFDERSVPVTGLLARTFHLIRMRRSSAVSALLILTRPLPNHTTDRALRQRGGSATTVRSALVGVGTVMSALASTVEQCAGA